MTSYIVKEEDGTSKLTLEEGGGSLLLEESQAEAPRVPISKVTTSGARW